MICPVCRGAGNVGVFPNLWRCWPCGGSGVRVQFGPALYGQGKGRSHDPD